MATTTYLNLFPRSRPCLIWLCWAAFFNSNEHNFHSVMSGPPPEICHLTVDRHHRWVAKILKISLLLFWQNQIDKNWNEKETLVQKSLTWCNFWAHEYVHFNCARKMIIVSAKKSCWAYKLTWKNWLKYSAKKYIAKVGLE